MHLNGTYKNSWNRKQNNVCVTLDSEVYRRKPLLTYAISGNVVGGGVGEFGECISIAEFCSSRVNFTVFDVYNITTTLRIGIPIPGSRIPGSRSNSLLLNPGIE